MTDDERGELVILQQARLRIAADALAIWRDSGHLDDKFIARNIVRAVIDDLET